ncbi:MULTISPECIES: PH-like domain-containing protein [unclassified Amycolatopsis]|uniref:PH-like domain-containing protein n=1 Tax=unclassified Amycolatopsis TaxID=2618356 RepID=UPI002875DB88|nr:MULTISPECIES: transporter [unclassified Amycolatopsis]MDS0138578.1 transporter [Amycolatopsis sp. 505]MDS0146145.1 transporter [Amycolatopsis sp. CM201R]
MERLWLVLAIVAFFLLCLWGMYVGWRRKSRSQSAQVPPFPAIPGEAGDVLLESTGVYLSTTIAGEWQNRIVTRGAGLRTGAVWRLHSAGIAVERGGAPDFWIPRDAVTGVRRDTKIAGKVMGTDALLVITWRLGDVELDTGFRGDDLDDYPQWIEQLKIKGGAQ